MKSRLRFAQKRSAILFLATAFACSPFLLPAQAVDPTAAPKPESVPAGDQLSIEDAQIILDQNYFSPGEIDGQYGRNLRGALAAFQQIHDLTPTGKLDDPTQQALRAAAREQALAQYTITAEDAQGPFVSEIPSRLPEQATLRSLGYRNIEEMLGERFHVSPKLLEKLNPESHFAAGETVRVPNVPQEPPALSPSDERTSRTAAASERKGENESAEQEATGRSKIEKDRAPKKPKVNITVSRQASALTVTTPGGDLVFYAPVTTGSEHDPLPIGQWRVVTVERKPVFHFNPQLFWDAKPDDVEAVLPAGPNNPVGTVWLDLSVEHYGIHGTPEPRKIGHAESHGCIRMTNWDALIVADLVSAGTQVNLTE